MKSLHSKLFFRYAALIFPIIVIFMVILYIILGNTLQKNATSELQADCYAGVWMHWASSTPDPSTGTPFLKTPTTDQVMGALQTAQAIGDDRLQEKYQGSSNPATWTHGSADQRATCLPRGLDSGDSPPCYTWSVPRV